MIYTVWEGYEMFVCCPNCGGQTQTQPGERYVICLHCESTFDIARSETPVYDPHSRENDEPIRVREDEDEQQNA